MKKIVLLDGYSLMYRAYHALQTAMNAPDGTPTNAVHGFIMMLLKVIEEEKPDALAVAFDLHAPTFRKKIYDGYKATRKPMPDDLRAQDPIIRELVARMGLPILECEGFEADDILGSVSAYCEKNDIEVCLVTGDRDSFQLTGEHTTVLYTRKGISEIERVTPEYIRANYGLTPVQLIDVKSLMGDTSDNIPGIAGIGEKTALRLVQTYEDLEGVLTRGAQEEKGKLRERLENGGDEARMSFTLAKIVRDVPVTIDPENWKLNDIGNALPRLRELGMMLAAKKLSEVSNIYGSPAVSADDEKEVLPETETLQIADAQALRELCSKQPAPAWVCIAVGADFELATPSVCIQLPLGGDLLFSGVTEEEAFEAASELINHAETVEMCNVRILPKKVMPDRSALFDIMLAAYVLNPQRPSFDPQALCEQEGISTYASAPALSLHMLASRQRAKLETDKGGEILDKIETPLAFVLNEMEDKGFLLDTDALHALGVRFASKIAELTEEIYGLMPERINLNSTKQLGEMLFERMGLPAQKKTSRGYSTNAEVLEALAEDYPVCAKILEYRKYQKLQSTYIDSLITLRDENNRVHTHFDQVSTATGRLSSSDPNLQNIPVRTEIGRDIRAAFIAPEGYTLVDADYSQIELRVLAHISGDETMIAAFNSDEDIHARTAAEVYGVPFESVTPQMRSASKAVNFGIVYGISDFALAKNIGTSRREAKAFMDRYFERYPGVKNYMERSVETAHRTGYAETLFGRRRYLPELNNSNFNIRSFGERCAMNSPIQGTAADIIKLAMIRVDEALRMAGMKTKLILQVHDELILEAPDGEVDAAKKLLKECMESVMQLRVPLKADVTAGRDWRACK